MNDNNDELYKDARLTLLSEIKSSLPKDWDSNFKVVFIEAYECTPSSEPGKIVLKWDFHKKFYDTKELSESKEPKFISAIPKMYELLAEVKNIDHIDPMGIHTPNLRIMVMITIIFCSVFLLCYIITMGFYFAGVKHEFGRLFWIIFIPVWQILMITSNLMANWIIKRNSIVKWVDGRKTLYDIVTDYNVQYFSKSQQALKLGKQGAWLEFRERHKHESLRELSPSRNDENSSKRFTDKDLTTSSPLPEPIVNSETKINEQSFANNGRDYRGTDEMEENVDGSDHL